jgi:DNA-binding NtrC family response regulator
LKILLRRLSILKGFGEVIPADLPAKYKSAAACFAETGIIDIPDQGLDFNTAVDQFENALILKALEKTGWNKNQASILLRLNRTTLVEKMKKKGLRTTNEGVELEGNA